MGVCSSCLGGNRHTSNSDPSDTSQLLGEQYHQHYGTSMTPGLPQPDPEEIRRQRDALERLCAQTQDNLIDVSKPLPHPDISDAPSIRTNIPHDLSRLFSEHFNLTASQTASRSASISHPYGSRNSSRPSSSGRNADIDEDEAVWLARVLPRDSAGPEGPQVWDRVAGEFEGKLIFDFDAVMGTCGQTIRAA